MYTTDPNTGSRLVLTTAAPAREPFSFTPPSIPSLALIQLKRCWLLSVLVVLVCAVGSPDRAQARVGEPICINYYCSRRSSLAGIATKFTGNRVSSETSQETSVGMARPMAPFTMFGNRSTTCMDSVRNEGPQSRLYLCTTLI